jgi:F0F1-type ATP synthase delta subunit
MRYALLEKLLSLLNCSEINPVLAGYFAKAMQVLLEKRKLDIMQYIFQYKEHILNILKHSYNKSIAEILSKILSNEDKYLTGITGEEYSKEKQEILRLMIEKMSPNNSIEDITNNCFILCTLVDTKQQMQFFMSDEILKKVFSIATSQHPMSLRAGLTYFITLNRLKNASPPSQAPSGQFNFLGMYGPPPSI